MAPVAELLSSAGHNAERYVLEPTKTLITEAILRRQQTTSGPVATVTVIQTQASSSGDNNQNNAQTLSGGAIAGIVIGSIVGVLLLIWIFRSCSNMGAPPVKGENPSGRAWYDGVEAEPYPRRSHSRHSGHSRHRSHSRRPSSHEVREYTTAVPVVAQPQPTYVYETDTRKARRGRSRDHRSRSASRY
ncbi:hypothetical protein CONLIGDRAFT_646009 [Coniochaeta ligniaria NRRL 30616]|uniref:Mid2 domain-containing protein n=1 Tax=Coniochaeta ligniaria NRRL 30616 TaxID=1408157 RepID=A0A1J7IJX0_9PEZI|nr:hypothetical protein CONLIGDRAFT_646009 [Coniochaeta ligniaria NRRL 30616]